MSNIFSDPPFARGRTLLGGEPIESDDAGLVAGRQLVGTVKAFQDIHPTNGQRFSNRLVYCVAARYTGLTDLDPTTTAGRVFLFQNATTLSEFASGGTSADIAAGKPCGVLDEYLTMTVRPNDIVWLVVKGPTSVVKADSNSVAAGGLVELGASVSTRVTPLTTGTAIAQSLAGAAVTGTAGTLLRVNKICNFDFM